MPETALVSFRKLAFFLMGNTFSQEPQHSCPRFLVFLGTSSFSAFHLVVHRPCNAATDTCRQPYNPFHFERIGTRADAHIHKAFAYKYLSDNICTVVAEWTHGYFCLGYFFSSTRFDPVTRLAQKELRQCVLVFVHDLGFRAGNCTGLSSNLGLFLSTGHKYLFLLQRHLIPFDS